MSLPDGMMAGLGSPPTSSDASQLTEDPVPVIDTSPESSLKMVKRQRKLQDFFPTIPKPAKPTFPFFDLPAEIRTMIYTLTFVSAFNIGRSPLIGADLNYLEFARTWRAYRRLDEALIQKRFYEEATHVFFTVNTFQLCSFKALGQYLAHIGPEAAGLIRSLHVQAKRDDPFPTLCHLSIATRLKHLHIEAYVYIESLGGARAVLKNAIEVVLHGHDEIEFDYNFMEPRLSTVDKSPSPKEILTMVIDPKARIREWSVPRKQELEKLYTALKKFVAKKRNGEWTARRVKFTTNPDFMYKHVMDGTLKNYGWRIKGIKHYYDAPSKAPRQTWSRPPVDCACDWCTYIRLEFEEDPLRHPDTIEDACALGH